MSKHAVAAEICWLNGRYLPLAKASISATDRGLLFGEGLFESWRTYRGRPFAVAEHVRRLADSARRLGIPFDAREDWEARSRTLVRRNRAEDRGVVVRLTITRGPGPVRLIAGPAVRPTRLLLMRAIDGDMTAARASGVPVHLLDYSQDDGVGMRSVKTINYLPAVIGKTTAVRNGCFEAIYRLADATLLEGTTSNLFVVKRGVLVTAPIAAGVLPGVTRALVMRLARRIADVKEARITTTDLLACDEAFLTASSIEIVPIVAAGRRRAAGGAPGPLTRELQRRYRGYVSRRVGIPVADLGE